MGMGQKSIFEIIKHPERQNQLLTESHQLALKGKDILADQNASDREISWAEDLVRKTEQ